MYSAINLKNAMGDGTTYFSVSLDLNEKVFLIRHYWPKLVIHEARNIKVYK